MTKSYQQQQADLNTRRLLSGAITMLQNAITDGATAGHSSSWIQQIQSAVDQLKDAAKHIGANT